MALDLFRVSGGLQIDESTQILEGAVAPTQDAPVGSLYTLTTNGVLYTKIAAGTGADKWSALADAAVVAAAIAVETAAREAADATLTTNLAAEVTRATGVEAQLQTDLTAEVTRATAAEGVLTTNLAAEVTRATAAEGVLTTNLAAEVTARIAGDAALDARIDALGNAFNYVGVLTGGASVGAATDLTALPAEGKNPGDYYKVQPLVTSTMAHPHSSRMLVTA